MMIICSRAITKKNKLALVPGYKEEKKDSISKLLVFWFFCCLFNIDSNIITQNG